MKDAVFISPHLDDAALSCGGAVAHLVAAGAVVTVVTVFTADPAPDAPLSALAVRNHRSWALGDLPFAARREEDAEAMRVLGAKAAHLGLADAMYRMDDRGRPLYRESITTGEPASWDRERLLPRLDALLRPVAAALPEARVFCPLGVGGHVDHVLVRAAAEGVWPPGRRAYYEEYPYVSRPWAEAAGEAGLHARALRLTDAELERRIRAVACYRSQLRGLFPTASERVREVLAARLPLVGGLVLGPPDVEASAARMRALLSADVASNGERYRWCDDAGDPFADPVGSSAGSGGYL